MRRFGFCLLACVLFTAPARPDSPAGKVVQETWEAAYLDGSKAGYVHTTIEEVQASDQTLLRATMELQLTLQRFKDVIQVHMTKSMDETPDGKVVAVAMRQELGKEQTLVMSGKVDGDEIQIHVKGNHPLDKKNPWNDKVVGLYSQERLFQTHKVKPGDRFSYLSFEPEATAVLTVQVEVKDYEDVKVPGSTAKQRLLRVEAVPEKFQGIQLPAMTLWLNDKLETVRSQSEMPWLGTLVLERSTREVALRKGTSTLTNIGRLITINRRIPRPYDTTAAVYRITVKGDDDPASTFAQDDRQQIKNAKGQSFELHVQAQRQPEANLKPAAVAEEFSKSCYFINSDDAKVKELAHRAVGEETDPWEQALLIEKWVHTHMVNVNFTEAFATSDHVARTLEGDCTEHAMLAAAMCRAVGVPSRAAVGLIYVESNRSPTMGFHMWSEVYVQGQWMPIDATLGRGYVGATHLKIADHSWSDIQSLTPLLPVLRVLGKVSIEVVRVTGAE